MNDLNIFDFNAIDMCTTFMHTFFLFTVFGAMIGLLTKAVRDFIVYVKKK